MTSAQAREGHSNYNGESTGVLLDVQATTAELHVHRPERPGSGALEETTEWMRAWGGQGSCVELNCGVDQQIGRRPKEVCRTKMGTGDICPSQGEFKCSGLVPQVGVREFEGLRREVEAKGFMTGRATRGREEETDGECNGHSI